MKKYFLASTLLLGSFASPTFAEEPSGFYLSLGGGLYSIGDIEGDIAPDTFSFQTDSPINYSLAIGKEFGDWRLEFNYSASTVSSDEITVVPAGQNAVSAPINPDLEVDVKSYMLYGYKDFTNNTKFSTYLGAGLGISSLDVPEQIINVGGANLPVPAADEEVFTFGIKLGAEYEIAQNTSIYSEVGYLNLASFETSDDEDYDSNNVLTIGAGLRFSF